MLRELGRLIRHSSSTVTSVRLQRTPFNSQRTRSYSPLNVHYLRSYSKMSADTTSKEAIAQDAVPQTLNEGPAAPQLGEDGQPISSKSAGQ
jgi:hypothetical protein